MKGREEVEQEKEQEGIPISTKPHHGKSFCKKKKYCKNVSEHKIAVARSWCVGQE